MPLVIDDGCHIRNYTSRDAEILDIPATITEIGSFSLDGHPELKEIHIPNSVRKIGYHVFYECFGLESISVSRGNWEFCDIDGVLYNQKKTKLLCCPGGREKIHIPAQVTEIEASNAFAGCINLKEITVDSKNPKFVTLDGILYEHDGAKLTKLVRCPVDKVSVHIPESITGIYRHAFEHCAELEEITIPESVTEVEDYTFRYCKNLKQIHFPKKLKDIGQHCFSECDSLTELILPNGLESIRPSAFNSCNNLNHLVIPESVRYVGYIIYPCNSLELLECRGIAVSRQEYAGLPSAASDIIYMIVEKDLENKMDSGIKYPVLYQMFLRNQDDKKIQAYIREQFDDILKSLIRNNQGQYVTDYLQSFRSCVRAENLKEFIQCATGNQKYEILYRLFRRYPDNKQIRDYLKDNFNEVILQLIAEKNSQAVKDYIEAFPQQLHTRNLDEFIRRAIDCQSYEIQLWLTDLKYQRGEFTEKDWTL